MVVVHALLLQFFFFQAEDGIRDTSVTGVQTCALPILETGTSVNNSSISFFSIDDTFFPPVFFAFLLDEFSVDAPDSLERFFWVVLEACSTEIGFLIGIVSKSSADGQVGHFLRGSSMQSKWT